MQQRVVVRLFTGMVPRKGAHLCLLDPETGILEPYELCDVSPNELPLLRVRPGLAPILVSASAQTTFPLTADNDSIS